MGMVGSEKIFSLPRFQKKNHRTVCSTLSVRIFPFKWDSHIPFPLKPVLTVLVEFMSHFLISAFPFYIFFLSFFLLFKAVPFPFAPENMSRDAKPRLYLSSTFLLSPFLLLCCCPAGSREKKVPFSSTPKQLFSSSSSSLRFGVGLGWKRLCRPWPPCLRIRRCLSRLPLLLHCALWCG